MTRGRADYYSPGDWNAQCFRCSRKFKASTMVREWQGYYVCPDCHEERQPQDFVKGVADTQIPPWTQPMPAPIFVGVCDPNDQSAITGYALAGCVIPGFVSPMFDSSIPYLPI